MRSFHTILCCLFFLIFFGAGQKASCSNNPALFAGRAQAYVDSALVYGGSNAMPIQAFRGVTVDSVALANMLAGVTTGATSDFEYEQLVRILLFAPGVYDTTILPTLRRVHYWVNYGDTLDCYWSENHMAQWMSSHWLLHEYYGIPADSNLRTRLVHFLNLKIQYGYYEFYSSVYNPYCLAGLLNLADFSQDTVVKNLAVKASQVLMKDFLTLANDKGVSYPTAGRNYSDKYDQPYGQNHNDIIWLLSGMGPMPIGSSHAGAFLSTTTVPLDSVILSWVPVIDTVYIRGHSLDAGYAMNSYLDSLDRIVFQWSAGEYFVPEYAEASFILITDSNLWHNQVFSVFLPLSTLAPSSIPGIAQNLYSASYSSIMCSDTIAIFKHNSITLSSIQDYWPGYWGYQQYPCVANVETTAVFTASGVVDSVWGNRSATNENDDLPYVKQVKNVALEMYRPLPKAPLLGVSNPTVSLHWRSGDFTEIRNDSLWLLGRVDNNYVGVRRSCVGTINGVWACDITPGSGWVIIVGDSLMYGSFNNFQTVIDSSKYTERWYYDSVAQQSDYFAQIIIDGDTINHVWANDSATTGIQNIKPDGTGLNVYPNPASTALNISLDNNPVNGTIEVYSTIGDLIFQSPITGKTVSIPISQWSDGIYAVRVVTESGTVSKCFVVSH
jgi:hypothetical protein